MRNHPGNKGPEWPVPNIEQVSSLYPKFMTAISAGGEWQPQGLPLQMRTVRLKNIPVAQIDGTHKGCHYKYMPMNHVAAPLVGAINDIKRK
jgi:hypothetical protein